VRTIIEVAEAYGGIPVLVFCAKKKIYIYNPPHLSGQGRCFPTENQIGFISIKVYIPY